MTQVIAGLALMVLMFLNNLGMWWFAFGIWPRSFGLWALFVAMGLVIHALLTVVAKSK